MLNFRDSALKHTAFDWKSLCLLVLKCLCESLDKQDRWALFASRVLQRLKNRTVLGSARTLLDTFQFAP